MRRNVSTIVFLFFILFFSHAGFSFGTVLDQNCIVNILNRTIQVGSDGSWVLPNVPANTGRIRARATCIYPTGETASGQSDYFSVSPNSLTEIGEISFVHNSPVPTRIFFGGTFPISLESIGERYSLYVAARYADGAERNVTDSEGINFGSTNNNVVSVSSDGIITAVGNGFALITARLNGVLATRQIFIVSSSDQDGDGLPDDFETSLGLNPADPIDALEDRDGDGLTALEEFNAGTNIDNIDTDGDGISDKEELESGSDGFVTNPLLADTDNDGINDGLEIFIGTNPTDSASGSLVDALNFITVSPSSLFLTYNSIDGEASTQLTVTGHMLDGSEIDLSRAPTGTTYQSNDVSIANFGINDGQVFAGQSGETEILVNSNGQSVTVNVEVINFEPTAVAAIDIPGYANNVDVQGNYAYVAAGNAGLQIVDVSDRASPFIKSSLDTQGTSIDVKVRGNYAYLADGDNGLLLVDVSDPIAPVLRAAVNTSGFAQDVAIQGDYAYVAAGLGGIDIFNIKDPLNVYSVGSNRDLTDVKALSVEGDLLSAVSASTLALFDVSDVQAPLRLRSVNIGNLKSVEMNNGYIYAAAFRTGWQSYRITELFTLEQVGGDSSFIPRDVAITDGFAFYAEQLFPNVVAYVNTRDADNPFFQNTIDLLPLGDYAGTGIAVDNTHAYITEEAGVVSADFGTTGTTRLFIAQYRLRQDTNNIAPTASLITPEDRSVLTEGSNISITADAMDDIAIAKLEFFVDQIKIGEDSTQPYSISYTVPFDRSLLQIQAKALDFGDNEGTSVLHLVEVQSDQDDDGLGDEEERDRWLTDPTDADSDDDALNDGEEIARGTNPNDPDSDGDGINDGQEVADGTDPTNPDGEAPKVSSSTPALNDTGIAENSPIQIVFSEAIQLQLIAGSFRLLQDGVTEIPGRIQLIGGDSELLFTPSTLLQDFTSHTIQVSNIRDKAGNLLATPYEITFTTGDTVDTDRPTAIVNPEQGSTEVPVNSVVSVLFSERINPATVDANALVLTDNFTNEVVNGVVDLMADGESLTFTPNEAYAVSRQYTLNLSDQITDLFGNSLVRQTLSFTTRFESDSTGPSLITTTVEEGQEGVPTNAVLKLRFDEAVSPISIKTIKLTSANGEVPVSYTVSSNGQVVALRPKALLAALSDYQLSIGFVEDASGNVLAELQNISFTTGDATDTQTGAVSTYSPRASGPAYNVALNTVVEWRLNEAIDPTSLTSNEVYLLDETTNRRIPSALTVIEEGRRIVLTPNQPLSAGHSFKAYLSYGDYLLDLAENRINRFTFTFITGDAIDEATPTVLSHNLSEATSAVGTNASITIELDEPLSPLCVTTDTVTLSDGVNEVEGSVYFGGELPTLTFDPTENLTADVNYTLTIDGACDLSGRQSLNYTLDFTTGSGVDTTQPSLLNLTPASGDTEVPLSSTITAVFSEPLNVYGFNLEINRERIRVYTTDGNIAGDWAINGNTAVFTPSDPLPGSSRILVSLDYVTDQAGNISRNSAKPFTTTAGEDVIAPQVVGVSPADGAIDIGPNTDVVLTFSESLNSGTIKNTNFVLYSDGELIKPLVYRSSDGRTVTLRGTWPTGKALSIVATSGVKDLSDNALADYVSLFTTSVIDEARPFVSRLYPGNGATNARPTQSIVLYTNEPMDEASLQEAFFVAQNGNLLDGTLALSGQGRTIEFTPDQAFAPGAFVQVFLESTATDTAGNPIYSYQAGFSIASGEAIGIAPVPVAYSPLNNQLDAPLNPQIQVAYSQTLNPASVTADRVYLQKSADGSTVSVTVSLTNGNRVIQVAPDTALEAGTQYYLALDPLIEDTDGDLQNTLQSLTFTTATDAVVDNQQPQVIAASPTEGMIDVALNPRFSLRFDETINGVGFDGSDDLDVSYAASNRELLYSRYEPFAPDTAITEPVPPVTDIAGNVIVPFLTNFRTGVQPDTAGPEVVNYSPDNNSVVPVNTLISVRLNELLDPISVTDGRFTVTDVTAGNVAVQGSAALEVDGQTAVWVADTALVADHRYQVRYNANGGITDISGNNSSSEIFFFRTGLSEDLTSPEIKATTVSEGQTDVPINARIRVRFSESIDDLDLSGVNLSVAGTVMPVNYSFNSDRSLLTLTPKQLLPANTSILLSISDVTDLSGNAVQSSQVGFTTGPSADAAGGFVEVFSPKQNATDVPLNAIIQLRVSEPIDPATVTSNEAFLAKLIVGANTQIIQVSGTLSLSEDNRLITIVPDDNLIAGQLYGIRFGYGDGVYDLAGNRITNIFDRFTVGDSVDLNPPQVISDSFSGVYTDVAVGVSPSITLDEPLNPICVTTDTVTVSDGAQLIQANVSLSSDLTILTLNLFPGLASDTTYTIILDGVCDLVGQELPLYNLVFTTEADGVVKVSPSSDSSDSLEEGGEVFMAVNTVTELIPSSVKSVFSELLNVFGELFNIAALTNREPNKQQVSIPLPSVEQAANVFTGRMAEEEFLEKPANKKVPAPVNLSLNVANITKAS